MHRDDYHHNKIQLYENHNLTFFDLSQLETAKGSIIVTNNLSLPEFDFPMVTTIGLEPDDESLGGNLYVTGNDILTHFDVPKLTEIGDFLEVNSNLVLPSMTYPLMGKIGKGLRILNNPKLDTWDVSSLTSIGTNLRIEYNTSFPECLAADLAATLQGLGALGGLYHSTGNNEECVCTEVDGMLEASCP